MRVKQTGRRRNDANTRELDYAEFFAANNLCNSGTCPNLQPDDEAERDLFFEFIDVRGNIFKPKRFYIAYKTETEKQFAESGSPATLNFHESNIDYPAGSPFDDIDQNLTDAKIVEKLLGLLDSSKLDFASELAARLGALHEIVNEDPNEPPISIDSLRSFINFIKNTPYLKRPSVVLTPDGEIRAEWRKASNKHFAVIFLPNDEARFVIFSPNSKDSDMIDRISGITSVDSLIENAKPHKVLDWASK